MGLVEDAIAAFRAGQTAGAQALAEEALCAARQAQDAAAEVDALCMLARVALRDEDLGRVADLAARARARGGGQLRLTRMPIHLQAVAARMGGDYASARRLYQESIEVNESLQEEQMVAAECRNLAYVELHDGRLERARSLFLEAEDRSRRIGYQALVPYLLGDAAVLALEDGHAARAARLAGAAAAALEAAGQVPDPDDAAEQVWLRGRLLGALSEAETTALWQAGKKLTPEKAIDLAARGRHG